jgi:DNA-binding NarL/FixJ family response regulator
MNTHDSGRESHSVRQVYGACLVPAKLTPREINVAKLLAEGYTVQNVALKLDISPHTVESHKRSIYAELDVLNRSDLTLKAIKYGIIDCPCQVHQPLRSAA